MTASKLVTCSAPGRPNILGGIMYLLTFDTLDKSLLVARKIYNGIKRVKVLPEYVDDNIETLVDILTSPIFCVSDFCKLRCVEVTDVFYDGKSIQIGYKLETHGNFTTNGKHQHSIHYQSAREAGESQMYRLCKLEYCDYNTCAN
ncbi:hypothetical protein KCU81_g4892, partial [Aureobasidium melanogenum]|uniref:Uncharacterized protein n=1 Tax=Aureobasidium melanogenum (strain CBS 110374) TaxID=1043003 RepID=A0A074VNT8_AURM1